ncbi:hypothetical protein D3C76_995000 [compost metagenome]
MFLQHRPQLFQALAVSLGQRIVDLVKTPIDAQKRYVLVRRLFIARQETIDAGPQHRRVAAHEPELFARLADQHLAIDAQFRQDLAPAFGNRLLDDGQMKDPALDHFQHVLDRQARVDPLDLDRRQFMQRQLLVDLADGVTGGAAVGQCQGFARQLFETGIATFTLDPHQHQRDVTGDRFTAADGEARLQVEQLAGGYQVALPALQRTEQLILGFGNDLEGDFLAIPGVAIEVLLKSAQAMVFDTDGLALDFARAVTALVDQHAQHTTAADVREVTDLGGRHGLQRPGQPRNRRHRQQQRATQQ